MNDFNNGPSPSTQGAGFSGEIRGQKPHAIDRELSTLLQDNYAVADSRRGVLSPEPVLPGTWARMDDAAIRAAGINPALMHDAKNGFDASLYRNARGHVVLAFTGTDEGQDWKHNLSQGLGLRDEQYDRAIFLGRKASDAFGENVIFTGQSLGGGLAAAASMVTAVPAVTFNAAGVHDNTLERYGLNADALKREAEQGLIRSYHVRNEILTHLQEDSIPLQWAMPDASGHRIELPDPDPLTFFERLVPGRMLRHRVELHSIEAVMQAQDLAQLQVRERNPDSGPRTIGDADSTPNRLLNDALGGLAPQRQQLGLEDNERFFNATAGVAARARLDGLERIDHLLGSAHGGSVFAVQGGLHDPAQRRSWINLDQAGEMPARLSALHLRESGQQQQAHAQQVEQRQYQAARF